MKKKMSTGRNKITVPSMHMEMCETWNNRFEQAQGKKTFTLVTISQKAAINGTYRHGWAAISTQNSFLVRETMFMIFVFLLGGVCVCVCV